MGAQRGMEKEHGGYNSPFGIHALFIPSSRLVLNQPGFATPLKVRSQHLWRCAAAMHSIIGSVGSGQETLFPTSMSRIYRKLIRCNPYNSQTNKEGFSSCENNWPETCQLTTYLILGHYEKVTHWLTSALTIYHFLAK